MNRTAPFLNSVLACPGCRAPLEANGPDQYRCTACGTAYPITNGIARFLGELSGKESQVRRSFNLEHSKYQETRHARFTPELVEHWLQDIQLPREAFKGKTVLDAGCGSGRWTYAMAMLGAQVVAVDFTDTGVHVTREATAHLDNVAVLQADVFHLPLKPESFDFVVSWGVLHHTTNTRAAFERLTPLVRKGGQLYVMVYEKHNPVKFFFTDVIRWFLRRLPEDRRYEACRFLLIKNRFLCSILSNLIICVRYPESGDPLEVSTRQFGLYDAYAPVFNRLHTREEVFSWFRSCNFDQITLTKPVRYTNPIDVFRFGECGTSVSVRGVRA